MTNESQAPTETELQFYVVVNHEEQYSIWPKHKTLPAGWKAVGKEDGKDECLAYIKEVWTDMRPLSLRIAMGEQSSPRSESEL